MCIRDRAKAAPASRNGDAAIAAIVDLIDMFFVKYLARRNPLRMIAPPTRVLFTFAKGYDLSSPLLQLSHSRVCQLILFIVTEV